jgi:hypothetical protein
MTSEGLGEVFKGDSADISAGKFPLVSMGGRADRQVCADGERGPPSARAEIIYIVLHHPTSIPSSIFSNASAPKVFVMSKLRSSRRTSS